MKEGLAGFKVNCKGTPVFLGLTDADEKPNRAFVHNLIEQKDIEVSITIYKDGSRDIGCPFLGKYGDRYQRCIKFSEYNTNIREEWCIHLKPSSSE